MIYRLKTTQSAAYLNGQEYIDKELISLAEYIANLKHNIHNGNNQKIPNDLVEIKKDGDGKPNIQENMRSRNLYSNCYAAQSKILLLL